MSFALIGAPCDDWTAILRSSSEYVRQAAFVGKNIFQKQVCLDVHKVANHECAGLLLVAVADRRHEFGVMIGAAGRRIPSPIEQDDERGTRNQLFEEADI